MIKTYFFQINFFFKTFPIFTLFRSTENSQILNLSAETSVDNLLPSF